MSVSLTAILDKIIKKAALEFLSNTKEGNMIYTNWHRAMENKSFRPPCQLFPFETKRCLGKTTSFMYYI